MNAAQKLLKELEDVPVVEPDKWERDAMDEFDAVRASGEIKNFHSLSEIQEEIESNGKISIRIPKMMHAELKKEAKKEGVSLNQYISYILASRSR